MISKNRRGKEDELAKAFPFFSIFSDFFPISERRKMGNAFNFSTEIQMDFNVD